MIQFEKEVVEYLNLPKIPAREWNGKEPFDKGVALLLLRGKTYAYAACSFNPDEGDKMPKVTKVFGIEPFVTVEKVFVVPNYMTVESDIQEMDLDEDSKKRASRMLNEAREIEDDGIEKQTVKMEDLPEWIFDEIHSKDEARAWIKAYQSRNKIKGKIPTNEDVIKLRLYSIYIELNNKPK